MATSKTSEAKAKIGLDSSAFEMGAKAVTNAANAMSGAVKSALAAAAVSIAGFVGVKSFGHVANSMKSVFDLGEQLELAGYKAYVAAGQVYTFNAAIQKGLSFKTTAKLVGDNADVLNRSASVFRDVSIKLWAVGERIRGFWLGLMERLSPVLSRFLDGALAHSLVEAGQKFGDAISNSLKVIYQLASDGTLWASLKTAFGVAFDYATERVVWLANLVFVSLKEMISKGIKEGFSEGLSQVKDSFIDILKYNPVLFPVYLGARAGKRASQTAPGVKKDFQMSSDLSQRTDDLAAAIMSALGKFNKETAGNPTSIFENVNTRQAAIGADSLTSIGGGGGVYLGLSVLDMNRQQLAVLERIEQKIGPIPGMQGRLYNGNPYLPMPEPYISRGKGVPIAN